MTVGLKVALLEKLSTRAQLFKGRKKNKNVKSEISKMGKTRKPK
jgi:hypothetical protein